MLLFVIIILSIKQKKEICGELKLINVNNHYVINYNWIKIGIIMNFHNIINHLKQNEQSLYIMICL